MSRLSVAVDVKKVGEGHRWAETETVRCMMDIWQRGFLTVEQIFCNTPYLDWYNPKPANCIKNSTELQ